jgi:hypothetical protein
MNKQDLEITMKIAEIEGLDFTDECRADFLTGIKENYIKVFNCQEYNPFDWSILGPLMVKYKVEIFYDEMTSQITEFGFNFIGNVPFNDESEIPRAILECIIKSKEQ